MTEPNARGKLRDSLRAFAWILGLAALGLGGYESERGKLEAPPVALLAIGTVFVLIAISGRLPRRLKIGDNEAEWADEIGEAVGRIAAAASPGHEAEVQEAIEEIAALSPALAFRAQRELSREQILLGALRAAAGQVGCTVGPGMSVGELACSAVVFDPKGRKLWVQISPGGTRAYYEALSANILPTLQAADSSITGVLYLGLYGVGRARTVRNVGLEQRGRIITIDLAEGVLDLARLVQDLSEWSEEGSRQG